MLRDAWRWLHAPAPSWAQLIALFLYLLAGLALALLVARRVAQLLQRTSVAEVTDWVAKAPTTNLRLLNGITLATVFVLGALVLDVLGLPVSETVLLYIGGFILIQEGLDVAQFGWKRGTFKPETAGMMRESVEPSNTPAADIVAATGEAPIAPIAPTAPAAPAAPDIVAAPLLDTSAIVRQGENARARAAGIQVPLQMPPPGGRGPTALAPDMPGRDIPGEGG